MRKFSFVLIAALAAACGQPQQATTTTAAPDAVATPNGGNPAGGDTIQGPFVAVSTTAMSITGDMSFSDEQVSFMNGVLVRTTHVATYSAYDPMAANGELFDLAAPGDDDRTVDVRRVDGQDVTDDERSQGGLCGRGTTPTYLALVHDQPITTLSVIVFTGADAPGRNATNSNVCAVFTYAGDN